MKWRGRKRSSNIEDRRASSGGMFRRSSGTGRSGFRIPTGGRSGGGLGIGVVIVVLIIGVALGINPMSLLDGSLGTGTSGPGSVSRPLPEAGEDELADFVAVVVQDTEDLWTEVFFENGMTYEPATVVLFTDTDRSACGLADARTGPFYCPGDRNVYIDLSFYETLRSQFGAPGDFAQAYVIAHEIGHHVQNLVGVLPEYSRAIQSMSEEEANAYSVRIELQADCYAGIWASYVGEENLLEKGDIEEAINAAEQIGDDAIQRRTQGMVIPKTFTHGTSEQRQDWFESGYSSGNVGQCDTFSNEF
ncbi:zinc metallopeptidase [Pelagibacterium flavum]|uniref:Zinc metallopeptidase n=1 Tax=Pelagibacterium flavum TaxID=2984530 RepID=A0ABY6IRX8_9HYPH|nr:neutral zinc metallopeptidase [Pelagibacterium sp. YIM 151497]MAN75990.1 neutral zinc metallopeptidase [Hyphomicrobiales bacterium]UYQ73378.1 zinc metallopeptidase [Pelagibacterium sp. YIM 151497]